MSIYNHKAKKLDVLQALNSESSQILLRSEDFFKQYGIEVWTQKEVGERETNLHNIVFA